MVATGLAAPAAQAQSGHEHGTGDVTVAANPTITLRGCPSCSSFNEKDGGGHILEILEISATLDGGARSTPTTVSLSIADDGTATHGSDYKGGLASPQRVTIAAGETSATAVMSLIVLDDTVAEGDETIIIEGAADGFTVNPFTITLVDNDEPSTSATLSVSPADILESASATAVTVTAKLDEGPRSDATVVSLMLGAPLLTPATTRTLRPRCRRLPSLQARCREPRRSLSPLSRTVSTTTRRRSPSRAALTATAASR